MDNINNRLLFIDNIRGIAFIFMVIQHIFYFYDVSKYYETDYASNSLISMSGTIARTIFIILSGYSLGLSYKNNKKKKNRFKTPILVLTHAMLLTCITWFLYPEFYIKFGVLHYIGLSTLLLSFIAPYKNLYLITLIGSLILYISTNNLPKIKNTVDLILGTGSSYNMMDYFPLLKWLPYSIIGLYLFKLNENLDLKILSSENILTNIGKNSLNYYTLHIIILLFFYKYLSLKE